MTFNVYGNLCAFLVNCHEVKIKESQLTFDRGTNCVKPTNNSGAKFVGHSMMYDICVHCTCVVLFIV